MIGKPNWFTYRIFGWGIAPKTWQGWVYIAVFVALIGFLTATTINNALKLWIYIIIVGVLSLDVIHIMMNLPKVHDERQNYNQLIIERNCSFAAIIALISVALYQSYMNKDLISQGQMAIDVSIFIVLGAMLLAKIASWIYVEKFK